MPLQLDAQHEGLLIIRASGKLTKEDYAQFLPQVDQLIKDHGKISILFDMQGFHGWEVGAAWDDARFAMHHFRDIERLAMIGEKRWQKVMTTLCKPFTRAEVRYFTHAESQAAREWIEHAPATQ